MTTAFSFEREFPLLDLGATTGILQSGAISPTVLGYGRSGTEAFSMDWDNEVSRVSAFESARRSLRQMDLDAYAVVAQLGHRASSWSWPLPRGSVGAEGKEILAIHMATSTGGSRTVAYPVLRTGSQTALGAPESSENTDVEWNPVGDVWHNPYCVGDRVTFRSPYTAVDAASDMWNRLVNMTRERIDKDPHHRHDYLKFLDEVRTGTFMVTERITKPENTLVLRPNTVFNPLGFVRATPEMLMLAANGSGDDNGAAPPK